MPFRLTGQPGVGGGLGQAPSCRNGTQPSPSDPLAAVCLCTLAVPLKRRGYDVCAASLAGLHMSIKL